MDDEAWRICYFKAIARSVLQPLVTVRTLQQLGYEPFPLVTGRRYFVGREAYFLTNSLKFAKGLVDKFDWKVLFTGVDGAICAHAVSNVVLMNTKLYLDKYYPELGGEPIKSNTDHIHETELTDEQCARHHFRRAIREIVTNSAAIVAARPFVVVTTRKIAQLIGGELKYGNCILSLYVIGDEEGIPGMFSGVIPELIAEFITICGTQMLLYAMNRGIVYLSKNYLKNKKGEEEEEKEKKLTNADEELLKLVKANMNPITTLITNSWKYPFSVVSTVMAVAGSGLVVATLPYSPTFDSWLEAYVYLKIRQGLKRGAKFFFREYAGPISVGTTGTLYATSAHFV